MIRNPAASQLLALRATIAHLCEVPASQGRKRKTHVCPDASIRHPRVFLFLMQIVTNVIEKGNCTSDDHRLILSNAVSSFGRTDVLCFRFQSPHRIWNSPSDSLWSVDRSAYNLSATEMVYKTMSLIFVVSFKNRNLTSETMHSSENLPDSSSSNKMITCFGLWYIHRYCLVVDITITLSPKKKRGFTSTKQISARKKLTCFPV